MTDPADMRRAYLRGELSESEVRPTWLEQFEAWFADAVADESVTEPNAMQLATADALGRPSVRTVLVKEITASGLVFYTNYESDKGVDLAVRSFAAVVFAWLPLERQVRLSGPVALVSRADTNAYFRSRPRGSQLGAWASPQSSVVASRSQLDAELATVTDRFAGVDELEAPPNWGGYRVAPESVEFWQGRTNRMHDRIRYRRESDGAWTIQRLAP